MRSVAPLPIAEPAPDSAYVQWIVADADDDESTLRSNLRLMAGQRVALVLPDSTDEYDTPVAMHLLARSACRYEVRLAIVSGRRQVRYLAKIEGLRCFRDSADVPRSERSSGPVGVAFAGLVFSVGRAVKQASSWLVAVGVILAIGGVVFLMVPRAVITVKPITDDLHSTLRLEVSSGATGADPSKGILPGRIVYLLVRVSGSTPIARPDRQFDGRAVGSIAFENRTPGAVIVPRGTDVSTLSGVHFGTVDSVTLPARAGATISVPIKAFSAGESSNVSRGEITQIAGPLRWLITAVNEDEVNGGGPGGKPIVTPWDTSKVMEQVTASARAEAAKLLADQLGPGEQPIPESIQVVPIDEAFSRKVGEVAPDISLTAQFRASATIYNQDQFRGLAVRMWHPAIRSGFNLQEDSVDIDPPTVVDMKPGFVTFNVSIHGIAYKSVNVDRIAAYARLRTAPAIVSDLSRDFDLAAPPVVNISPPWIGRAFRVSVDVDATTPRLPPSPGAPADRGRG